MEIAALRKVELHCHLDGLVSPDLLTALEARGVSHPIPVDRLRAVWPVRSRQDWMESYASVVGPHLRNNADLLLHILVQHARRLVSQNVFYAEIMLSSFTLQAREVEEQTALFRRFRDVATAQEESGLQIELLVAVGRRAELDVFERQAERVLAAARAGLVRAVAIAGDERAVSIRTLQPFLEEFRRAGLQIEIHAGEFGQPEFMWDALEWGRPDRIGHGLAVFEDPSLLAYVRDHRIHLEMCPTSNVVLGGVKSLERHPIRRALREGLEVSVSTDNPGPLGISLEGELESLSGVGGLTYADLESLQSRALAARFAPELRVKGL